MVSQNQKEKAELFLKLHHGEDILVLLNSWDPGSSRLIEASGFKAIATTSMGVSASLGYPDKQVIPFHEMVEAVTRIINKVNLPVTMDFEGGFGNNTREIIGFAEEIIKIGISGINIEDSLKTETGLLDAEEFCERISAIRSLSESLGFHLVINARTDVFLASWGSPDGRLGETIRRGNKYKEAGADCIFIPDVFEKEKIAVLVKEIKAPINILANSTGGKGLPPSLPELKKLGVARLSLGSSIQKSTLALVRKIADEISREGTYQILSDSLSPMENTVKAYRMAAGI